VPGDRLLEGFKRQKISLWLLNLGNVLPMTTTGRAAVMMTETAGTALSALFCI
jgi:hypothetical protein